MHQGDHTDFELLKKKLVETMQQSFPGISSSISVWKGQDIVNFQEELLMKVNAHISEKWFYTHMKSSGGKLPRIDVLNLLSKYAGYADWSDFVYKNNGERPASAIKSGNKYFILVPLIAIGIMGLLLLFYKMVNTREYTFCFYDTNTKEPITNTLIEVSLILENESQQNYLCDVNGCVTLKTDQSFIRMVINSPYYRNDTLKRALKKFNQQESFGLQANDYALMIKYFSGNYVDDWQKRRTKLDEMFDENALIYQVMDDENGTGMELFTKWEFIDKLTMPSRSLKNIEILNTKYVGDRITVLRFMTKDKN